MLFSVTLKLVMASNLEVPLKRFFFFCIFLLFLIITTQICQKKTLKVYFLGKCAILRFSMANGLGTSFGACDVRSCV